MNMLLFGVVAVGAYLLLKNNATATNNLSQLTPAQLAALNAQTQSNSLLGNILKSIASGKQQTPTPTKASGGGAGSGGGGGSVPTAPKVGNTGQGASVIPQLDGNGGVVDQYGNPIYGTGDAQQIAKQSGTPVLVPGGVFNPDGSFTPDSGVGSGSFNSSTDTSGLPMPDPFSTEGGTATGDLSSIANSPVATLPTFDPGVATTTSSVDNFIPDNTDTSSAYVADIAPVDYASADPSAFDTTSFY